MSIRRNAIFIGAVTLFLGTCVPVSSAHFLATDHTIGAVLHMDPGDDPIAGSQTGFFFEMKDTAGKFTPAACDCTFVVLESGKQLFSQPLFQNSDKPSLSNASVFYTFPTRDVYQVRIIGKPLTPNAFQQFTLIWDVRVDRTNDVNATSSPSWFRVHLPLILGIGIIFVFFTILVVSDFRKPKQSEQKKR